jgi:HEAT repeat protein
MPEPADQPAKPRSERPSTGSGPRATSRSDGALLQGKPFRTWRPMAAWTAALLLALGLVWLGAGAYMMYRRACRVQEIIDSSILNARSPDYDGAVQKLGGQHDALAELRLYMRFPSRVASAKSTAIHVFACCGKEALPDLIRYMRSPNCSVRNDALRGMNTLGHDAAAALPLIIAATRSSQASERKAAVDALMRVGGNSEEVRTALCARLEDADEEVAVGAAVWLKSAGAEAASAVPTLTKLSSDSRFRVKITAISTLGRIGPAAAKAVPALEAALGDPDPEVRAAPANALKIIREEAAGE